MSGAGPTRLTFTGTRDFEALAAAEAWCRVAGISVGSLRADAPRALKRGDFMVAKWRNLTPMERHAVDGVMTAPGRTFRTGPVFVELRPPTAAEIWGDDALAHLPSQQGT